MHSRLPSLLSVMAIEKIMADFQIGEIVTRNHRTSRRIPTEWSGRRVTSFEPASPTKTARQDDVLLRRSGLSWFVIAAIGQAAFIWMILVHYWVKTLSGEAVGWNDKPLIKGHVSGDDVGNVMFAIHVMLAAVITLGGLMQLVPAIRQRMPMLHRWNGRLFFVVAFAMALGGFWLTWGRGTYLSLVSGVSVSINGLLILLFATLAWRMALKRDFDNHRRWALRAFLVVNGVWFLRVGLMAWILISGGGVGMNRTLSGPADIVLQFGSYLIPLAVLEAYLRAQRSASGRTKRLVAALVIVATAITAIGVVGAILFMWWPYMT